MKGAARHKQGPSKARSLLFQPHGPETFSERKVKGKFGELLTFTAAPFTTPPSVDSIRCCNLFVAELSVSLDLHCPCRRRLRIQSAASTTTAAPASIPGRSHAMEASLNGTQQVMAAAMEAFDAIVNEVKGHIAEYNKTTGAWQAIKAFIAAVNWQVWQRSPARRRVVAVKHGHANCTCEWAPCQRCEMSRTLLPANAGALDPRPAGLPRGLAAAGAGAAAQLRLPVLRGLHSKCVPQIQ